MPAPVAIDRQLVQALRTAGAEALEHSGGTLLEHLVGTAELLVRRGHGPEVVHAGLFHAVYGTERFSAKLDPGLSRAEVVALIGERAELLVYLYSAIKRGALLSDTPTIHRDSVLLPGTSGGKRYRVTAQTFSELEAIARCNAQEMAARVGARQDSGRPRRRAAFFGLPGSLGAETRLALVGVPSDLGSRKVGARYGPRLLRDATASLCFRAVDASGLFNLEAGRFVANASEVVDLGDVALDGRSIDRQLEDVALKLREIPSECGTLLIGGDHVFTLSSVLERAPVNTVLVHVDQHIDFQVWGEFGPVGPKSLDQPTNSNFMSHIAERRPDIEILQVGVQGLVSVPGGNSLERDLVGRYLRRAARRISSFEVECWGADVLEEALPQGRDVYLSVDLDVIEAPAMGELAYPAAVGVSYARLVHVLQKVVQRNKICGCDVMEFGKEETKRTAAACRLAADLLARLVWLLVGDKRRQSDGLRKPHGS